jgi:hypothetical protein
LSHVAPDYPGIPSRNKLPSKPLVEVEREAVSDADTVRAFHSHGKLGFSVGSNVVVAAITAGLTWLASHGSGAASRLREQGRPERHGQARKRTL